MVRFLLAAFLAAAAGLAGTHAARADLVSIGLQEAGVRGGNITTVGSGSGTTASVKLGYGSFVINAALAQDTVGAGGLPELLDSASVDASSSVPGTLHVWITAQGLTSPAGFADIISSFAVDALLGDVKSVTEQTFYSAADALYATATPLSSAKFAAVGLGTGLAGVDFTGGLFSITEEYTIVMTGAGVVLDTINATVPEPGSLPLLATALVGLGMTHRGRRRA